VPPHSFTPMNGLDSVRLCASIQIVEFLYKFRLCKRARYTAFSPFMGGVVVLISERATSITLIGPAFRYIREGLLPQIEAYEALPGTLRLRSCGELHACQKGTRCTRSLIKTTNAPKAFRPRLMPITRLKIYNVVYSNIPGRA
jgi:hypothetical protein